MPGIVNLIVVQKDTYILYLPIYVCYLLYALKGFTIVNFCSNGCCCSDLCNDDNSRTRSFIFEFDETNLCRTLAL